MGVLHTLRAGLCHPLAAARALRWRTLSRTPGQLQCVRLRQGSSRLWVDPKDEGISRQLYIRRQREEHEVAALLSILTPGQTIIETGANIGFYVVLEAERIGTNGRIYAIEPSPTNIELLKKNVQLNSLASIVHVYHAALSNKTGTETLHIAKQSNLNRIGVDHAKEDPKYVGTVNVPSYRLDDFLDQHHIDPTTIGLIRMDIEGYECQVIEGMPRTLRNARSLALAMEIHPAMIRRSSGKEALRQMIETLIESGFEVYWSHYDPAHVAEPIEIGRDPRALLKFSSPLGVIFRRRR